MLQMLAKDRYEALKPDREDRWRWSHRTLCQKPIAEQNTGGQGGIGTTQPTLTSGFRPLRGHSHSSPQSN